MALIEIEGPDGKTETMGGTYDEKTRTITSTGGNRKVHVSQNDRVRSYEGCFIATEVYGGINKPEVIILRKYRDEIIIPLGYIGKKFVKFYYKVGPYLAKFLHNFPSLKPMTRKLLDKIAYKCENKLNKS